MTDQLTMLDGPPTSEAERKRAKRRASETPRGYYARPGTGPEGETCKTCKHKVCFGASKTWWKCGKARRLWTGSRRTDILLRAPACAGWEGDDG